jgi:hypothetical protein
MINVYGSIGFTILSNNRHKILILADMHDSLPNCSNQISISEWLKTKFNNSHILLEEVPRDNVILEELWSNSPHTQLLKNLFLKNSKIIIPVDIRPFLIPFSWEIIDSEFNNVTLFQYLKNIDDFFSLKNPYIYRKLPNYRLKYLTQSKIGEHYINIKENYELFLKNNEENLIKTIIYLYKNNIKVLESVNNILNNIMEWYICAKINLYKNKPVILHTGLAHSEKIIKWLQNNYDYNIITQNGINNLDETINTTLDGCIHLPAQYNNIF